MLIRKRYSQSSVDVVPREEKCDLQCAECKHAENNKLLRTLNLQFLYVRHGKNEDGEIHNDIDGIGTNEKQSVIDAACSIFDALIPVSTHRNAMQDGSNVLGHRTLALPAMTRLSRLCYSCNKPAKYSGCQNSDRPSDTGHFENAPVECKQRQLAKSRGGAIEDLFDEKVQQCIADNRVVAICKCLVMDAEAKMNPCNDPSMSKCLQYLEAMYDSCSVLVYGATF